MDFQLVPKDSIVIDEEVVPNIRSIDKTHIKELIKSIASNGVREPLIVMPSPTLENQFVVVSGFHRFEALQRIDELTEVPVLIFEGDPDESQLVNFISNTVRKNLIASQVASIASKMVDSGSKIGDIAKSIGYSKTRLQSMVGIWSKACEELRQAGIDGEVTFSTMSEIVGQTEDPQGQEIKMSRSIRAEKKATARGEGKHKAKEKGRKAAGMAKKKPGKKLLVDGIIRSATVSKEAGNFSHAHGFALGLKVALGEESIEECLAGIEDGVTYVVELPKVGPALPTLRVAEDSE